jgi:hypothetical protein
MKNIVIILYLLFHINNAFGYSDFDVIDKACTDSSKNYAIFGHILNKELIKIIDKSEDNSELRRSYINQLKAYSDKHLDEIYLQEEKVELIHRKNNYFSEFQANIYKKISYSVMVTILSNAWNLKYIEDSETKIRRDIELWCRITYDKPAR